MFIGNFVQWVSLFDNSVKGCRRFLDRVWNIQENIVPGETYSKALETLMHKTIKKVSEDYETLKFNTAIAALMSLLNEFKKVENINDAEIKDFLVMLNPVAPHMTEEMWSVLGYEGMIVDQKWPQFDPEKVVDDIIEMAVQINGKVRSTITLPVDADAAAAHDLAMADEKIQQFTEGKTIVKEIFVPGKIYNIVVK